MLSFGSGYREVLDKLSSQDFELLKRAFGMYQFGPRQSYYESATLISSLSMLFGESSKLHDVYPHIFKDATKTNTIEAALAKLDEVLLD